MTTSASLPTHQTQYPEPLVSVWLITYNHEAYIAQAIEGVLMQQTNFAVELVIGEDYSSDRTREIVQAYKNNYPDRIKLFLSPQNLGMVPVLKPTYAMCTGKYVAMLDGDDYWTDPHKLQKQIDLMEGDDSCHISFHNVQIYYEDTQHYFQTNPVWGNKSHTLGLHELINLGNPIYTVSAVFRRPNWELPSYYYELPYPDLAIYYLLLANGSKMIYLPEVMGTYRVHSQGAFTSMNWYQKRMKSFLFFDIMQLYLPSRYYEQIEAERQFVLYDLLIDSLKKRQLKKAIRFYQLIDWHRISVPQLGISRAHYVSFSCIRLLGKLTLTRT